MNGMLTKMFACKLDSGPSDCSDSSVHGGKIRGALHISMEFCSNKRNVFHYFYLGRYLKTLK